MNAANNTLLHEYSYDAWGRMRNTANLTTYSPGSEPVLFVAGRGFTGHEHLPWFNLINMNGRLYDPLTAQFLSPDNYVQDPTFTQNYNRYIYCLNNPLKYVDPSGYKQLKSWEDFWEVINNLMDYGGSWNSETGYSDGRQGGSIEGYGVLSGSGFQGPGQPYMLGEVTITAQAPEKNSSDPSRRDNWFSNIDWGELVNQADDWFTVAAMADAQLPIGDVVGLAAMGGARLGKLVFGSKTGTTAFRSVGAAGKEIFNPKNFKAVSESFLNRVGIYDIHAFKAEWLGTNQNLQLFDVVKHTSTNELLIIRKSTQEVIERTYIIVP